MMTAILFLLALAAVIAIAVSPTATQRSASPGRPGRRLPPAPKSPKARLNAAARDECEALNRGVRQQTRGTDEWEDRAWFHPEDWMRMRSPIVLLVATARADGQVHQEEADIIASWIGWRLKNSHWGDSYTGPKVKALRELTVRLTPSQAEVEAALADCAQSLSKKQHTAFLERVDRLSVLSGDAGRRLAQQVRSRLEMVAVAVAVAVAAA